VENKLPEWFSYPAEHKRVLELKIDNLDPWYYYSEQEVVSEYNSLKGRFPGLDLVPFAKKDGTDYVVCWEKSGGNEKVFMVADYMSDGWSYKTEYSSYWDWFRLAVNDMIEQEQPYR